MLARKCGVVRHVSGSIKKDFAVPRPAHALARGAVGGYVRRVALQRPTGVFEELVDERMRTGKGCRLFQVAVNGDRGEIFLFKGDVRFDLCILKSAEEEFRGVFVDAVAAEIVDLLQRRWFPLVDVLNVFLREFAVLHHLTEADADALPRPGGKTETKIPRKILREL